MQTLKTLSLVPFFFSISMGAAPCRADDGVAKVKFNEAKALYAARADSAKLEAALDALTKAEAEASDKDLKYDVLVLSSMFLYFKGMHEKADKVKIDTFEAGRLKAEAARKIADFAEGYYWSAANLARWGEVIGIPQNLFKKDELIKLLEALPSKNCKDGGLGEAYEGYGADRILGRVYYKLPPFAGGDKDQALELLKTAYENAKDYGLNIIYYAESLYAKDGEEFKKEAKEILDLFLEQDPQKFNADRIPETIDEKALAKKVRSDMSK